MIRFFLVPLFVFISIAALAGVPGDKKSGVPFSPCISVLVGSSQQNIEFDFVSDIVKYIVTSDLTFAQKQKIWKDSVPQIQSMRSLFISLEIFFESHGVQGVAYMGGEAGTDKSSLLVIFANGTAVAKPNSGWLLNYVYNYKSAGNKTISISQGKPMDYFVTQLMKYLESQ